MDRTMAMWGGGAAITLACMRPSSASAAFDSPQVRPSLVQVHGYTVLSHSYEFLL